MRPRKAIIQLDHVWKTYRTGGVYVHALKDISLIVYPGELLVVIGKSGSGKSTIMNLIGCLDVPTRGKISLEEHDVSTLHESELARIRGRKIGFIFQQFNLISTLTALENVALPAAFQSMPDAGAYVRARSLLTFVGMADRLGHKPTQLSGGQMQRVAIARALMNNPEVILADEPTGALDSKTGEQMIRMLQELHHTQKKSVVIVTHDQQFIAYANRVIELKDGEVIRDEYVKQRAHHRGGMSYETHTIT